MNREQLLAKQRGISEPAKRGVERNGTRLVVERSHTVRFCHKILHHQILLVLCGMETPRGSLLGTSSPLQRMAAIRLPCSCKLLCFLKRIGYLRALGKDLRVDTRRPIQQHTAGLAFEDDNHEGISLLHGTTDCDAPIRSTGHRKNMCIGLTARRSTPR